MLFYSFFKTLVSKEAATTKVKTQITSGLFCELRNKRFARSLFQRLYSDQGMSH